MDTQTVETDLSKMDEALAILSLGEESDPNRLTQEHIHGARTYLLGAMDREFRLHRGSGRAPANASNGLRVSRPVHHRALAGRRG